MSDRPDPMTTS